MFRRILLITAILGTLFQVGHFVEHATQSYEWLFVNHSRAWMSELACHLSLLFNASMPKGMEILHLAGNGIFLITLIIWARLMPNKWMTRGLWVEGFHLTEHINLTSTVFLYGHAVGWSTLFGFAPTLFGHDGAVGFRVLWHFGMNLIPSVFMFIAMLQRLSKPKPDLGFEFIDYRM